MAGKEQKVQEGCLALNQPRASHRVFQPRTSGHGFAIQYPPLPSPHVQPLAEPWNAAVAWATSVYQPSILRLGLTAFIPVRCPCSRHRRFDSPGCMVRLSLQLAPHPRPSIPTFTLMHLYLCKPCRHFVVRVSIFTDPFLLFAGQG